MEQDRRDRVRYLGAFERDNRQRSKNLAIQINLVGALPEAIEQRRQATNRARLQANLLGAENGRHP